MPQWQGTADVTNANTPNYGPRGVEAFVPVSGDVYLPGTVLQIVPIDKQTQPNFLSVQPATHLTSNSVGVVAQDWPGFNGSIGTPSYTAPSTESLVRGTQFVKGVIKGVAPILIDQSGSNAVTVVDKQPLIVSATSDGYAQGATKGSGALGGLGTVAMAVLPSTGIGSSLTAASLAQASQTATVAGTPAAGDVLTLTIQSPYTQASPGVVQTAAWSLTLTTASAVSATTAAAAMVAYLNAQPNFSLYFIATNSSGVITVTVNTLANPFLVTFGSGTLLQGQFYIDISGMVANTLTFACSVSAGAGSTFTAGSTTFASGTGYKGHIPAMILGEF